jgi:hypothetical protein
MAYLPHDQQHLDDEVDDQGDRPGLGGWRAAARLRNLPSPQPGAPGGPEPG